MYESAFSTTQYESGISFSSVQYQFSFSAAAVAKQYRALLC